VKRLAKNKKAEFFVFSAIGFIMLVESDPIFLQR
jgi:hypothetical protein